MSTMPMSAANPRLHGHDTFVDEVTDHLEVLHRVALRLTRRPQEAEDLVQETATRALSRRAQYQPGTNLRAWLLTIERSLFVSAYRRARRGPVTQRLDEVAEDSLYGRGAQMASPSAESALWQEWMDQDLVAALHALPEHYREAVLLSDVEGLSYAEIAQRMGCRPGTVMSRLHRGRRLLRRALADGGRVPEARVVRSRQSEQPLRAVA
jgi:RNA polymerase sigma-70 factor, ECF subfamily